MRHLFSTTSLARLSLLALVLALTVALAPGCASTKCHWEASISGECGTPSDHLSTEPNKPCHAKITWKLVCETDNDPEKPKNPKAWELPGALDWIRDLSWRFLDREFDVLPEDVKVHLNSNLPLASLEDAILAWNLVDRDGQPLRSGELPLRLWRADGEHAVLVPEEGASFDEAARALAELLAVAPEDVVVDEWSLRVPVAEEVLGDDGTPRIDVTDGWLSILGWTP